MKNEIIVGVVTAVATAGIIAASEASFGWISSALNNDPLPSGMIVMTNRECAALEGRWSVFTEAGGRFPVAAGVATDARGERRQFVLGQADSEGEYRHVLAPSEMPSHIHGTRFNVNGEGENPDDKVSHALLTDGPRIGSVTALSKPPEDHLGLPNNNIPPYYIFNFCIKK